MEVILVCLLLNKALCLTMQVHFNLVYYFYMCGTGFFLYLSHPQSCQYTLHLYCFCIDVLEDCLSTGQNMYHTCEGNQLN